jgi:hypothetical protein
MLLVNRNYVTAVDESGPGSLSPRCRSVSALQQLSFHNLVFTDPDDFHGIGAAMHTHQVPFGDYNKVTITHCPATHQLVNGLAVNLGMDAR